MWNKTEWWIFLTAFFLIALFTKIEAKTNDASRMGAIQSIVENKTFAIDNSRFAWTVDRVSINGKFYSDKPALSYLVGVPIYFILYTIGINFSNAPKLSYYLITLLTIGLSTSIMLVYFFRLLKKYNLDDRERLFYTASLGLGTLVLPYSVVFNNHGLAAALLLISFYYLVLNLNARNTWQYIVAGCMAGFTTTIDVIAGGVFLLLSSLFLFPRIGFKTAFFILAAVIPIFVYLSINLAISGSITPFNIRPELFEYQGSKVTLESLSGVSRPASYLTYAIALTVGEKGFFSYTPILFFSLGALIIAVADKKYRTEAILVAVGIIATLFYYITRTNNFAGCSYGLRWTVPFIPVLYYFTPLLFKQKMNTPPFVKISFGIMLVFSIVFSFMGVIDPWVCSHKLIPYIGSPPT
jgi:hypothetical protein